MSESIGKMVDFVSSDSQLVLKAAAVAGFNGYLFSVSLLASMLPELMGNNDNTLDQWFISFNVMKITQNLVNKSYFVFYGSEGIQKKTLNNNDGDHEGREIVPDEFNNEYGYYSISLRHYVYEMMLEDQKKYFHGKCAVFLETEYLRNSLSSPSHYRRIGCHWEQAGDWTKAMCFYCHAGILYDKIGVYEDTYSCYALSYSMLGSMKRKVNFEEGKLQLVDVVDRFYLLRNKSYNPYEKENESDRSPVSDLFSNSIDNLHIAIRMLAKYAFITQTITLKARNAPDLFTEALNIFCLASEAPLTNFRITDTSIIFPTLSGLTTLLRNKRIPDDVDNTLEKRMNYLFLTLAEEYNETVHIIQAKAMFSIFCVKKNLPDDFEKQLDSMRNLYNFDQHSQQIIELYGNEWALSRFALSIIQLMQYGKFRKSEIYYNLVNNNYEKVTHVNYIGGILLHMAADNLYIGNYKTAGYFIEKSMSIKAFYLFKPAIPYFYYLIKKLNNPDYQPSANEPALCLVESNLLNIINIDNQTIEMRPTYYNVIEIISARSLESLQAELCLLKLMNWTSGDQEMYNKYLDAGLKYVDTFLFLPYSKGFEVILPYTNCLLLRVQLMMLDNRSPVEQRVEQCLVVLKDLLALSEKLKILLVKLLVGYYLIKLKIDVDEGRKALEPFLKENCDSNSNSDNNDKNEPVVESILRLENFPLFKSIIDVYNKSN